MSGTRDYPIQKSRVHFVSYIQRDGIFVELNGYVELSVSNCSTIVCIEPQWNRGRLYHAAQISTLSLSELTWIQAYSRLTGTCGVICMGFDGAPGLLYQTERKPDLPVSRRVGSELSVRSLLNQQLLVSRFTNLPCARVCHPSVWRTIVRVSVVNSALFMMCVINLRIFATYGWWPATAVNTSPRSLVSSLSRPRPSTIPEIIKVL